MPENDLTTVQVDVETREKLRKLADLNKRSMTKQISFMVDRELQAQLTDPRSPSEPNSAPAPTAGD